MGIKDLNTFLKNNVPECMKDVNLQDYRGKKMCIDASIYLYKYLYKNERFLEGFFQQIYRLVSNGITPVYVFDGKPPKEKARVIMNRKGKKLGIINKLMELKQKQKSISNVEDSKKIEDEIAKVNKKLINITKEHIDSLKYMLELMNIPYIQASEEADIYCSCLYRNNKVDLCLSDDMDLLVSGTKKLVRNFNVSSNFVFEYNLDIILKKLELSMDQWIDFCILCGCDYTNKIYGIGAKNAYKFIKDYVSIENIIDNVYKVNSRFKIPKDFDFITARNIFKNGDLSNTTYCPIIINSINNNQYRDILKFIKSNSQLTYKQIDNRVLQIYGNFHRRNNYVAVY